MEGEVLLSLIVSLGAIVLGGIGFVVFQLLKDGTQEPKAEVIKPNDIAKTLQEGIKSKEPTQKPEPTPQKLQKSPSKVTFSLVDFSKDILQKLGINISEKSWAAHQSQEERPILSLKDVLLKEKNKSFKMEEPKEGTASLKITPIETPNIKPSLSNEDEKNIEEEITFATELSELKEKHQRLDKLFIERTQEYEKNKSALDSELRNRKEFNKVRDLLEKELSDTKDRLRKTQAEAASTKMETENYKKRIHQLEEKATKLEKEILAKEKEIDHLGERLKIFTNTSTAAPAAVELSIKTSHPPPAQTEQSIEPPIVSHDQPTPEAVSAPEIPSESEKNDQVSEVNSDILHPNPIEQQTETKENTGPDHVS